MREWSKYYQNPYYLEKSRMQIMSPDMRGLFKKYTGLKDGYRVLDVGCGTGLFAFYLADTVSGCSFTGLDTDKGLIEAAAQRVKQKKESKDGNTFEFIQADATDMPFEDGIFDLVVSHTFLTSIADYKGAIRQMQRVCKKGGIIASVTCADFKGLNINQGNYPTDMKWVRQYRKLENKVKGLYEHVLPLGLYANGISENKVPEVFRQMGLTNVGVYPQGYFFSLSNAAMSIDDRRRYIELDYKAEKEKLQNVYTIKGAGRYLTHEEYEEYIDLLGQRRDSLLEYIGENDIWDFMSGLNYLVVGTNTVCSGDAANAAAKENASDGAESEYEKTKFKKRPPEQTVRIIKNILKDIGLKTTEKYTDSGVKAAHSLRITIEGTDIGQNGKGTTGDYALASGYAEFMERLQTGYLIQNDVGFDFYSPDITDMSEDVFIHDNALTEQSLKAVKAADVPPFLMFDFDCRKELDKWSFAKKSGKYRAVPFNNIFNGTTEYIPEIIYRSIYFTNGSCAGNTKEEALVQGLSEIMERYAADTILKKKLTPPEISLGYFEIYPTLKNLFMQFGQYPDIRLRVMDASLGKGLPVVCAAMINTKTGRILLKFGAHPRREVALERCLTEILQGRNITDSGVLAEFDISDSAEAMSLSNRFNLLKAGTGLYPYECYAGNPSWEYKGFEEAPFKVEEQYRYMLEKCKSLGWDVYARDCCFSDFKTYQLIVPGISDILNFGKVRIYEKKILYELMPFIRNPRKAGRKELEEVYSYLGLMQARQIESNYSFIAQIPVSPDVMGVTLNAGLYRAFLALALGETGEAAKNLGYYAKKGNEITGIYILWQLVKADAQGLDMKTVKNSLEAVFGAEQTEQAAYAMEHPLDMLPGLGCADADGPDISSNCCEACDYSDLCCMDIVKDAAGNIDRAFKAARALIQA